MKDDQKNIKIFSIRQTVSRHTWPTLLNLLISQPHIILNSILTNC